MTPILHADTSRVSVLIDGAAHELKAKLLHGAQFVESVTDAASQEIAVSLCRDIRKLISDVEESRKAVKAPVLALGKIIDKRAQEFTEELQNSLDAIGTMVTGYQINERMRVAKEEELRKAEVFRLEEERRKAALVALQLGKTITTDEDLEKAIQAEEDARAARERADAVIMAPLPAVNKAAGAVIRWVPDITVEDIHEVYRVRPDLVRLELNKSEFNRTVVRGVTVPGLKVEWHQETNFRR